MIQATYVKNSCFFLKKKGYMSTNQSDWTGEREH